MLCLPERHLERELWLECFLQQLHPITVSRLDAMCEQHLLHKDRNGASMLQTAEVQQSNLYTLNDTRLHFNSTVL